MKLILEGFGGVLVFDEVQTMSGPSNPRIDHKFRHLKMQKFTTLPTPYQAKLRILDHFGGGGPDGGPNLGSRVQFWPFWRVLGGVLGVGSWTCQILMPNPAKSQS